MGNVRNVSLQDFVSGQVISFLVIQRETHLGILLYNIEDANLASLLDTEFRNEFKKRGLDIKVVVSEGGLEEHCLFSAGRNHLSEDIPGYYPINVSYFLDSLNPEPRFNSYH